MTAAAQRLAEAGLERAAQRIDWARACVHAGNLERAELQIEGAHLVLSQVGLVLELEQDDNRNQLELPWGQP